MEINKNFEIVELKNVAEMDIEDLTESTGGWAELLVGGVFGILCYAAYEIGRSDGKKSNNPW